MIFRPTARHRFQRRRHTRFEPRFEFLEERRLLTSYLVTGVNDSGAGSLRQAILDANAAAGPDEIVFAIPGTGPHTIQPLSALPEVIDGVTIDGYTQPGAAVNTLDAGTNAVLQIELDGSLAGDDVSGLVFRNASSVVRGLAVNRFDGAGVAVWDVYDGGHSVIEGNFLGTDITGRLPRGNRSDGIRLEAVWVGSAAVGGADPAARNIISASTGENYMGQNGSAGNGVYTAQAANVVIAGNLIGTDSTGTQSLGNAADGIKVTFSDNTRIGGTGSGEGNLISGNAAYGVELAVLHGTVVQGNQIGTDVSGSQALANGAGMLIAHSSTTVIGGASAGAGNLISGNSGVGIGLSLATDSIVQGNRIGTDRNGMHPLANGAGIAVSDASSRNLIGGSIAEAANLISANSSHGILLNGSGVTGNRIQGNRIGTDATGNGGLGNGVTGIAIIAGASGNLVGGTDTGSGNLIAYNQQSGVGVFWEGTANAILGNSIRDNNALGISFSGDWPTPNDPLDADTGPNGLQNFPLLSGATATEVSGSLNSLPNSRFRLEFFANATADPSGYGEGGRLAGAFEVTTDGAGNADFTAPLAALLPGEEFISAPATRLEWAGAVWTPTDTSEFSPVISVASVKLDSSGNLRVTDAKLGGRDDSLTLSRVTFDAVPYVRVHDPNQLLGAGEGCRQIDPHTVDTPLSAITGEILIDTLGGDDRLTIDFAGGNLIPPGGIHFAGGSGGSDSLALAGGSTIGVAHAFTNPSDGSITLSGVLAGTIHYTGLEPISDNLDATDREFTFLGGTEQIVIAAGATLPNRIDSTLGEWVEFTNPTGSLKINAGSGDDLITVSSLHAAFDASLTINGDAGHDTVNLNADISFAADEDLDVNLSDDATSGDVDSINVGAGVNLATAGTGTIELRASQKIALAGGSSLATEDGSLVVAANQQAAAANGTFVGLMIDDASITTAGGNIELRGRGGDTGNGNYGVAIHSASVQAGGAGTVTVVGSGGASSGNSNYGVDVYGGGLVTSSGGDVQVTGTGSGAGGGGIGVLVRYGGRIGAGGPGKVTVTGTGSLASGDGNSGVWVNGTGATISSSGGDVLVAGIGRGSGTSQNSRGVQVQAGGLVTAGGTGTVTVEGRGGVGEGNQNYGVYLVGSESTVSAVTSAAGNVHIGGTGGGAGASNLNTGVLVGVGGRIDAGGGGTVTVDGTGGSGWGTGNAGVRVGGVGALITANGGDISVTGTGGGGASPLGIQVTSDGSIAGATAGPTVSLTADSIDLASAVSIQAGPNVVALRPKTPGTLINLGSTTNVTAGTLELSDAELDRITASTIQVGAATDPLIVSAPISLAGGISLSAIATSIAFATATADLSTQESGAITLSATRSISLASGSSITAADGDVTLLANRGTTPASGNFVGIDINSAVIEVSGEGRLELRGRGGDDATSSQFGIQVRGTGQILGGIGSVVVEGTGGAGAANSNTGVYLNTTGLAISSTAGDISVAGTGGGSGASAGNLGIRSLGRVIAGGTGTVTLNGAGGTGLGNGNHGILLTGSSALVSSNGGVVVVIGTGGGAGASGANHGVFLTNGGQIVGGGMGPVDVTGTAGRGSGNESTGVFLRDSGSAILTSGGDVTVVGMGGGEGTSNAGRGVFAYGGGQIRAAGNGSVSVTGVGGATSGLGNDGVWLVYGGSLISSENGDVSVTGVGGSEGGSGGGYGVCVNLGALVAAGGTGSLSVTGTGAQGNGANSHGVFVADIGLGFASTDGDIVVQATAGTGPNSSALRLTPSQGISTSGRGNVHVTADSMVFVGGIDAGGNLVSLAPASAGTTINLGGSDAVGILGLTDAELDRITAGTLRVGGDGSGAITVTADVTRPASTDLELVSGSDVILSGGQVDTGGGTLLLDSGVSPAAVQPGKPGTDVIAGTLSFGGDLEIKVNGTVVDTQYTQLKVAGIVDLTGAELKISGTYTPVTADRLLIVNNDGGDAVIGTFNSLTEGASVNLNGTPMAITYLGGDGNDVELIADTPPIADAGGPYVVAEGSSTQLDARGTSDNEPSNTALTYEWDLDFDGVTFDGDAAGMQPTVSFPDNFAPRTIAVRVTDNGGLSDLATTTLEVLNVAPDITGLSSSAPMCSGVAEGQAVTVTAAFSDPGTLDTHSAVIEWGDGATGNVLLNAGQTTLTAGHAYSPGGLYTVTVTLTDNDGGTTSQSALTAVVGAGVVNRVLYVVGTPGDDQVHLQTHGQGQLRVHADFFPEAAHRSYSTQALDQIIVYLCGGDDHLTTAGNVNLPTYIHGGDGNDLIHWAGGPAVAVGGAGNDDLQGGLGQNILIGGAGSDTLRAGRNGDVLIDASTQLDHNAQALFALLAEWNSDGPREDRASALAAALEIDDLGDERDTLYGGAGHDLFFAELEDILQGREDGDRIVAR